MITVTLVLVLTGPSPSPVAVGVISLTADEFDKSLEFLDGESVLTLWPEGVPLDGTPITEIHYPLLAIVIVSYIYAGAVIICALVCLASTFILRKKK